MMIAGFGFRAGVSLASLRQVLSATGLADQVMALATATDKADHLAPLAAEMQVPLIAVAPNVLAQSKTVTQSQASLDARGTGSLAEATALAAAGPGAQLRVARIIGSDRTATCAIAEGARL